MRMAYRNYKKHYSDCETVPGTYDKGTKTIEVIVPDGRMKPSGVRGECFSTYELWYEFPDGRKCFTPYRATCRKNAEKQLRKDLMRMPGCHPCDPPEGREAKIFTGGGCRGI